MGLFRTIKERWASETPKFFKAVRKFSVTVGGSCMAVWMANDSLSLDLHDNILMVCKYAIASCAAMGLTAQLTRENPPFNEIAQQQGQEETPQEQTQS